MTALGPGVSDKDTTYDWTFIKPSKKSPLEIKHIDAMDRLDELNRAYCRDVDSWVIKRNDLIDLGNHEINLHNPDKAKEYFAAADAVKAEDEARWTECEEAYDLVLSLGKQVHCEHVWVDTGGMHFSAGEVWDDVRSECIKCGVEYGLFHSSNITNADAKSENDTEIIPI